MGRARLRTLDARGNAINIRRGDNALYVLAPARVPPIPAWRMMMAYDSSQTPPSRLDDATLEDLSAALRLYLLDETSSHKLRDVLFRMASEARAKTILPEHLLIALKDVWNALPEVRAMPEITQQVRLLQRVVTMCIKEYYSG